MSFNLYTVGANFVSDFFTPLLIAFLWQGTFICYLGILIQNFHFHAGVYLAISGLLLITFSLSYAFILALAIVCYETYFIASKASRHRRRWLAIIFSGSLFGIFFQLLAENIIRSLQGLPFPEIAPRIVIIFMVMMLFIPLLVAGIIALFWALGTRVYHRDQEFNNLKARAELAALTERNRIAREMHDIIAHSLTVVIAQADGGRFAAQKSPEQAVAALTTIAKIGRDSLLQMRSLLSVLRDTAETRELTVTPGLSNLTSLVAEARRAGLQLDFQITGEQILLNEALELTVFRIAQEAITNAIKHAPHSKTRLLIDYGKRAQKPRLLTIQADSAADLRNKQAKIPGAGRGLTGITERAAMYQGTASWGASKLFVGGFNLTVTLELPK